MHVVGTLSDALGELGVYAGHSHGLTRTPIVSRRTGSVHQELAMYELAPGGSVNRQLHAFEQAKYILEGELALEVGGRTEALAVHDYAFVQVGVTHSLGNRSTAPVRWLEVSAPSPGADLEDTVFERDGASPDLPFRRDRFNEDELPSPSENIGLAGFEGANVGGAALKMLVDRDFGASQFNLMCVQYAPGGMIEKHDHAFEEAFFFVSGEIEAVLDGTTYRLRAGDYCWSGVGSMHSFANPAKEPVRWLETQVPQPPSRHQARFAGDWRRFIAAG